MSKITPCLWFDSNAEEAAKFYTSIFKNSKIGNITRYGEAGFEIHRKPAGTVLTIEFEINGQAFTALNGGPMFQFTEAVSLMVDCKTQEEVDYYWEKLSAGGDPQARQCGWLKDKYGLSWQIVPAALSKWMQDKDPARTGRVMQALLEMTKLDIAKLQQAYDQK